MENTIRAALAIAAVFAGSLPGRAQAPRIELNASERPAPGRGWTAVVAPNGALEFIHDGVSYGVLAPSLFEAGWKRATLSPEPAGEVGGELAGQIVAPSGGIVDTRVRVQVAEGGVLRYACTMTPRSALLLHGMNVSLAMPFALAAGGTWTADDRRGAVPGDDPGVVPEMPRLHTGASREIGLTNPAGRSLRFRLPEGQHTLIQDDRRWGPTFTIRIGPHAEPVEWPAGRALKIEMDISADGPVAIAREAPVAPVPAEGDWVPLEAELDIAQGSALDLSGAPWLDAPAGKHGRLIARPDGAFAFEKAPDVPRRFYGVNLCFSANGPDREGADRLADRLARLGYNAVRFHHHERELADPGDPDALRAEALERFDYLFAALKRRGIYLSADLYASRVVPAAAVWPGAEGALEMEEFKLLAAVNERAEENLRAFARRWLGRVNPHTGLTWAADPALAWIGLVNEDNPANHAGRFPPRAEAEWQAAWNRWLKARYPRPGAIAASWGEDSANGALFGADPLPDDAAADTPRGRDFAAFCAETQRAFHGRLARFLREELGAKALVTDLNGWANRRAYAWARAAFDYADDHFYVDPPEFLDQPGRPPSRAAHRHPAETGAAGGAASAFVRLFGKPFTVSEFGGAAPGPHRGAGGLVTGALAALQDWGGVWRFAYGHDRERLFEPAPIDYVDLASDPLNQAADRLALLVFLRGDARPAPAAVALAGGAEDFVGLRARNRPAAPPWSPLAFVARVGYRADGAGAAAPADEVRLPLSAGGPDPDAPETGAFVLAALRERGLPAENRTDLAAGVLESATGEWLMDASRRAIVLATPRTAGGAGEAGLRFTADAVEIAILDAPATVVAASLDGRPLRASGRILVTHLTDLRNTGQRVGGPDGRVLEAWGALPYRARPGRATVRIRREDGVPHPLRAWALSPGGRRLGEVPVAVDPDGALRIECDVRGPGGARLLYELAAE